MKSTDGNADTIWPNVGLPKYRRSARRAEMRPYFSSLLPVADIDVGRSLGANMFLLEKGNNAEHRTGSPLTLATMADAYNIRIGGYFDAQGTATAMRGSRHDTLPCRMRGHYRRAAVRTTACSRSCSWLRSPSVKLPKSLSRGLRGATRRRCGGLAKQVPRNVENSEASTALGERLEVRLDENFDGLFAGVDLDTDSLVAEVDLVASPVLSSNDGVRH